MIIIGLLRTIVVNCRIGSLEKYDEYVLEECNVNCRIGSLEKKMELVEAVRSVNCRIGSLEIHFPLDIRHPICKLPHRQLRKLH